MGRRIDLDVNSELGNPQALVIAPTVSYFCSEVDHEAANGVLSLHPIFTYKLADGLDRTVASTAFGEDWAHVNEHQASGLVRCWIAQSYAFGHNFMAPHRQWCYTRQKGTHDYYGPTGQYAWLYQFVRRQARLLDRYEAVAPIALVYDNAARRNRKGDIESITQAAATPATVAPAARNGKGDIEPIAQALVRRNLPFTVIIAGDDWLPYRLNRRQMAKFQAVIVTNDLAMDHGQKKILDRVSSMGRLVVWPDDERLAKLVPPPVMIEGTDQILAVPRSIPGDTAAPVVVHLLNRHYDAGHDMLVPQEDFILKIRTELFGAGHFSKATLHDPQNAAARLEISSLDGVTTIKVPRVDLWAILELDR